MSDIKAEPFIDSLDLDTVIESTSGEYIVKHPVTGLPTVARILIAGFAHSVRRESVYKYMRLAHAEIASTGRVRVSDPEEDELKQTAFAAACTLGWSNLALGGKQLVYTAEAALPLYTDPRYHWLRDQVTAALDQREIFFDAAGA